MDWTFLVLSAVVVVLAAVVIPNATPNLVPDLVWRTSWFAAAFVALLCLEGTTWEAYQLLIAFLFGISVWIILNREDNSTTHE